MNTKKQVKIIYADIKGVQRTTPSVSIQFQKPLDPEGEYLVLAKQHFLMPNGKPYLLYSICTPVQQIKEDQNELLAAVKKVARRVAVQGAHEVINAAGGEPRAQVKKLEGRGR